MQFPFFQAPWLGNGFVIGMTAICHVLISHGFAIGGFSLLLASEWRRHGNSFQQPDEWFQFNRRFMRFLVVIVTIVGAATGAGIWFTTGALAPRGIASILRLFFWPWFIEWAVFVSEMVVLLYIYFRWDQWADRPKTKLRWLCGYVALAVLSAVLISGILGFMLTPGAWGVTGTLSAAFFNPSFAPQLLTRLLIGILIGCPVAMVVALRSPFSTGFKREALRFFGFLMLLDIPALVFTFGWYAANVPVGLLDRTLFAVLTSRLTSTPELLVIANTLAALFALALAIAALWGRVRATRWLLAPAMIFIVGFVGQFERVREFIRGPYLMPTYMYANGMLVEEPASLQTAGIAARDAWFQHEPNSDDPLAIGAFAFKRNCAACHTVGGLNDIRLRVNGRSEDGIFVIMGRTHEMVSFMPPFSGTDEERRLAAHFVFELAEGNVEMTSLSKMRPLVEGNKQ